MFDDDLDKPKKSSQMIIGQSLESFSVHELETYIQALHNEIRRVQNDIKKKKASQDAANSIFKS